MVFYRAPTDQTVLAQVGAGFVVTAGLRNEIAPFLGKCREIFQSLNLPSSNRISLCIDRYLGSERAINYGVYHHAEWILNDEGPLATRPRWFPVGPIVSFHHVVSPEAEALWNAHVSIGKDGSGRGRYWDWSSLTLVSIVTEIGETGRLMEFMWGYRLFAVVTDFESRNATEGDKYVREGNCSRALEAPRPVFDREDAVMFVQRFEFGITLKYECDPQINEEEIMFDRFLERGEYGTIFRVRCPEPQRFPLEHPSSRSPISVSVEEEV
jgi:hypothetical protein